MEDYKSIRVITADYLACIRPAVVPDCIWESLFW
jgi:hypothetical protein